MLPRDVVTAPIRRRIEALERLEGDAAQRPILVITRYDSEPVGIEMPPPLPDVVRSPGESFDDLVARAAACVPRATPVLLFAKYADEGAASCAR